jgi:hypothetical protein
MTVSKDYIKIKYPRKCEHCDYVSNNPSMYFYHKQTHAPIPYEKLCDHGCGSRAHYRGTGGKYTCEKVSQHCPEYIKKHSKRVTKQWENNKERKEYTKKSFIERLHNQEVIDRIKETKRKKTGLLTPEQMKDYRHYARRIRTRAQKWAREQGHILGQQTYHVDHKLSVLDAWIAQLPIDIVNHPANLQIIEAKQNSSKGSKSIITVEELLRIITTS